MLVQSEVRVGSKWHGVGSIFEKITNENNHLYTLNQLN
ncbi:Hypoticical protein [Pectobacterium parmentieri]|uniref:Hypoticical protein n=1 Tax=Pectobacterium parmentieri TaxID=1905730 RepID=A0A0H3IC45_PECPM|nr:Hypoticical protein [Pectobacterium parmentieri]